MQFLHLVNIDQGGRTFGSRDKSLEKIVLQAEKKIINQNLRLVFLQQKERLILCVYLQIYAQKQKVVL